MTLTASYPNNVVNFGPDKVNTTDLVVANDPNTLRAEVVAVETTLGTTPSLSTAPLSSASWYNDGRDYNTITARLANIEAGIVADTHTQYVKIAGGSTITAGSSSTKGLVVKGAASQSANLQEWQNSTGTVVAYVDASGNFNATNITGGNNDNAAGGVVTSFLLGGM